MKNGTHRFVDLIPGSSKLVGPEEKFSDPRLVNLFYEVMAWFFVQVPNGDQWKKDGFAERIFETADISESDCKEVCKHLRLFTAFTGYDLINVRREDLRLMVTIVNLKQRPPVLVAQAHA